MRLRAERATGTAARQTSLNLSYKHNDRSRVASGVGTALPRLATRGTNQGDEPSPPRWLGICKRIAAGLVLITASAALGPNGAEPGSPQPIIPPANEILALVKYEHPRLLVSRKDFDALKQRISSNLQLNDWRAKLREKAQKIIKQPPSQYEIPDGLRLLATCSGAFGSVDPG